MVINNSPREGLNFMMITFFGLSDDGERGFRLCSLESLLLLCFRYLHSKCKPAKEEEED